jgi:hypothetical protein
MLRFAALLDPMLAIYAKMSIIHEFKNPSLGTLSYRRRGCSWLCLQLQQQRVQLDRRQ